MASRVLGLMREMLFAGLFGGSRWMDCFLLAFRVPNLLRDLFAEGALSQAFVTTFSKKIKTEGDASAWKLATKMLTLSTVWMSLLTILGILAAPWIVDLLTMMGRSPKSTRHFDAEEIALTVTMVRIMFPFIAIISVSALVMGMLNAKNVFGMPALASCFFNIGSMLGGVAIGWWLEPEPGWGPRSLIGFSIGVVIGGLAQLFCQFPSLHRVGYRWAMDFRWFDPGVRKILQLMTPATIAASVVQVNVVVNTIFAYGVGEGAVSWLNYAFRLMQLPIGVFGVAVATVTLPALSRAATESCHGEFRHTLAKGLGLVTFLVLPCAIGLALLAEPIISLLYERGNFHAADRVQTALALRAYGYGLLAYAWLKVLQPAFYAVDRRWVPMIVSISAIAINLGLNWLFVYKMHWGHQSLALTTSITATINFLALFAAMRWITGDFGSKELAVLTLKLLVAGAALAGVCLAANHFWFARLDELSFFGCLGGLLVTCGVAALAYHLTAHLLHVAEARESWEMLMKKLKK